MSIKKIAKMSMFCAMALVSALLIKIPLFVPYLKYDPSNVFIGLGALILGPVAGLIMSLVTGIVDMFLPNSSSGWVGLLMYLIASVAYVLPLSLIHLRHKSNKALVVGLIISTIILTAAMIPANLVLTTVYNGMPFEEVVKLILPVLMPFNLLKGVINSVLIYILYTSIGTTIKEL